MKKIQASIEEFYVIVKIPVEENTFLPKNLFGYYNIYNNKENVRILLKIANNYNDHRYYTLYHSALSWAEECNGNTRKTSIKNDFSGRYIRIKFVFSNLESLINFQKGFDANVESEAD